MAHPSVVVLNENGLAIRTDMHMPDSLLARLVKFDERLKRRTGLRLRFHPQPQIPFDGIGVVAEVGVRLPCHLGKKGVEAKRLGREQSRDRRHVLTSDLGRHVAHRLREAGHVGGDALEEVRRSFRREVAVPDLRL
ncbi:MULTISPECIES: hypothetical protein [unclassified Sphingomonas]|uniref:hypothetical protein n=1 Tax=unclassified Sphingomonas TaxID=196159 RepID=UPI0009E829B8